MTDKDKDEIIEMATHVCKWIGWAKMKRYDPILAYVERLRDLIEEKTGQEIGEYT